MEILENIIIISWNQYFPYLCTIVFYSLLQILPLNEKCPVWKSPAVNSNGSFPNIRIPEDVSPGSNISTFEATDDDLGVDGIVTYHLVSVTTSK